MMMRNRRYTLRAALLGAVAASIVAINPGIVTAGNARVDVLFHRAVALPGVVLPPGEYRFEIANSDTSADVVRVSDPARTHVHYMGATIRIERPASLRNGTTFSLGEAPEGAAVPIRAWFPMGQSFGYQFVH